MSELGGLDFPALFSAARDCDVDALRELLSAGVSVDHVCRVGGIERGAFILTPLQRVCKAGMNSGKKFEGKVACVKLLIEHGACLDAGAPGTPGQNAYDANTRLDNLTPLMYAAISGDLDIVNILISAGSDVNALCCGWRDAIPRYSALDMATLPYRSRDPKGCDTMVETLLRAGANPNPPEMNGTIAIHMTIAQGRRRVWPLLLRAGAGSSFRWLRYSPDAPLLAENRCRRRLQGVREGPPRETPGNFQAKVYAPRSRRARAAHRRVLFSCRLLLKDVFVYTSFTRCFVVVERLGLVVVRRRDRFWDGEELCTW